MRASCRRLAAAFCLASLSAGPSLAQATVEPAQRLVLEGLPVYVQRTGGDEVAIRVHVRTVAGSDALSALTAAWLVAGGTRSYPGADFDKACEQLGFRLDASASGGLITLRAAVPSERFRPAIRLIADLLMNPAFAPRVRESAVAAATSASSTDVVAMARRAFDPLAGRGDLSFAAIDRERVVAHHRDHAGVDRTVVAVAGPLVRATVERQLRSAFLGYGRVSASAGTASQAAVGVGVSVSEREREPGRTRLLLARQGLSPRHPDWMALELGILSVFHGEVPLRLVILERRMHVVQALDGSDLLVLELVVPSATLQPTVRAYRNLAASLGRGEVSAAAVDRARRHLAALVPPPDAPHAASAHALLEALGAAADQPSDRHLRLQSLSRRDLTRTAARYLK